MEKIYTIRPGDTLSAIGKAAGIELKKILALNPQIENPNLVRPGQQIVLPASADRSEVLRKVARDTFPQDYPDWFRVASREENTGIAEYGSGSNPRIVEYLATCTDLSARDRSDDGTAWCSAFVNWCLHVAGITGTNSAEARSWRKWGKDDPNPATGAITVWSRYKGAEGKLKLVGGHVAFLVEDRGDTLYVLGGNQGDCVCRRSYPRSGFLKDSVSGGVRVKNKYELIGFRAP